MKITKTTIDKKIILSLVGRLDTITSNQLTEELDRLFQEGDFNLVLDFHEIEYISSAGLRVIIDTQKKINAHGGKLELTSMNESIRSIFDITGFSKILTIS